MLKRKIPGAQEFFVCPNLIKNHAKKQRITRINPICRTENRSEHSRINTA